MYEERETSQFPWLASGKMKQAVDCIPIPASITEPSQASTPLYFKLLVKTAMRMVKKKNRKLLDT